MSPRYHNRSHSRFSGHATYADTRIDHLLVVAGGLSLVVMDLPTAVPALGPQVLTSAHWIVLCRVVTAPYLTNRVADDIECGALR